MKDQFSSISILLCLVLTTPAFAQLKTDPSKEDEKVSRLEGRVIHAITGEPLRKATVVLRRGGESDPRGFAFVTDESGKFVFDKVTPASYILEARRSGFRDGQYGPKDGAGVTVLQLAGGERLKDLEIQLSPYAVISGRVVDEDGEPMQGIEVVGLSSYKGRDGVVQWSKGPEAITNDAGEYRLVDVYPGRYAIVARSRRITRGTASHTTWVGHGSNETYEPQYYANAPNAGSATIVEVTPGQEKRGVDFQLRKVKSFAVRGRVVSPAPPLKDNPIVVRIQPSDKSDRSNEMFTTSQQENGIFEFTGVLPGTYNVEASFLFNERELYGKATAKVSDESVNGVEIVLEHGFKVEGKVTIEGSEGKGISALPNSTEFVIQLRRAEQRLNFFETDVARVASDGDFQMKGIMPGKCSLFISPRLLRDAYVKSIRVGDQEVVGKEFEISGPVRIDVTLSDKPGVVSGVVEDAKGQPAPGALLFLGSKVADRRDLDRLDFADQNGRFELRAVVPGEYRVWALDRLTVAIEELRSVQPAEALTIRVAEGEKQAVKLKLITTR
jgi:protocatechuate 3,4-dioxygenase beta subunit